MGKEKIIYHDTDGDWEGSSPLFDCVMVTACAAGSGLMFWTLYHAWRWLFG